MIKEKFLQPILGTNKKNPVFTVWLKKEDNTLHIFYGMELIGIVPHNKTHIEYKIFIGILYNSGVKVKSLVEAFRVDKKTIKKIGDALKLDSPEEMITILRGRENNTKLTDEIKAYIKIRFPKIYKEEKYRYSRTMLNEIKEVFRKKISSETIRPLLKELKIEYNTAPVKRGKKELTCDLDNHTKEPEYTTLLAQVNNSLNNKELQKENKESISESEILNTHNRKDSPPCNEETNSYLCHHAGIVFFHNILNKVEKSSKDFGWILKQWLASIFLESVNIEQSKLLDFEDLSKIIGYSISTLRRQRKYLKEIAAKEHTANLMKLNAMEVGIDRYSDFYYDPHGKKYTGEMKVLKGWCGNLNRVDKVLYLDFISTHEGHPVYIGYEDNYYDLRKRFKKIVEEFRTITGIVKDKTLTFIIDRGIYDIKIFKEIIKIKNQHIITWEKNYRHDIEWDKKNSTRFVITRKRNNAADKLTYIFEYIEKDWKRDEEMKIIKVRATNHKMRTIEVGILTDDKKRDSKEIITLIFKRWVQENDFKYLGNHFGINEITSYSTKPYKALEGYLEDKQIKSGEYKAWDMERKKMTKTLANCLLREHKKTKEDSKLKQEIENLDKSLEQIRKKMKVTEKEISKLDYLIEQNYVRLNTNCKSIMDALKIIARNTFYKEIQLFKKLYNNYRDDHVIFRNLIQASGIIGNIHSTLNIYLIPTMNYSPKLKAIVNRIFELRNKSDQKMPNGSEKNFNLFLAKKEGIKIAISNL